MIFRRFVRICIARAHKDLHLSVPGEDFNKAFGPCVFQGSAGYPAQLDHVGIMIGLFLYFNGKRAIKTDEVARRQCSRAACFHKKKTAWRRNPSRSLEKACLPVL